MIHWPDIDKIFLDMDGTLLDLHYDNHFWLEHVPRRYAEANSLSLQQSKDFLYARFKEDEGTLNWYCVDYWSDQLGLDIPLLKQEVNHLIAVHPHVIDFLKAARAMNKRVVLVTNAHGKVLDIKMNRTQLAGYFDRLITAHDLGLPKEGTGFWVRFQEIEAFDSERTLLVDDSLPVLDAARAYGFRHLLCIHAPDSRAGSRRISAYPAIDTFDEITPK
ncbi:MAG: GMP/IMP nucleotidase [Gammaproteobacteria bacterium]|nr:GMP/IMP nucleotidase [Gammaproteobacteria bacterium]